MEHINSNETALARYCGPFLGPLRIGYVNDDRFPYVFQASHTSKLAGIWVDVWRHVAALLNTTIVFERANDYGETHLVNGSFGGAAGMIQSGQIHGLLDAWFMSADRVKYLEYSAPVSYGMHSFYLRDNTADVWDISDLFVFPLEIWICILLSISLVYGTAVAKRYLQSSSTAVIDKSIPSYCFVLSGLVINMSYQSTFKITAARNAPQPALSISHLLDSFEENSADIIAPMQAALESPLVDAFANLTGSNPFQYEKNTQREIEMLCDTSRRSFLLSMQHNRFPDFVFSRTPLKYECDIMRPVFVSNQQTWPAATVSESAADVAQYASKYPRIHSVMPLEQEPLVCFLRSGASRIRGPLSEILLGMYNMDKMKYFWLPKYLSFATKSQVVPGVMQKYSFDQYKLNVLQYPLILLALGYSIACIVLLIEKYAKIPQGVQIVHRKWQL